MSTPSEINVPRSHDRIGIEKYIEQMKGAKFIQPPAPAGYWKAPCDAPQCHGGDVRMYDVHGGYNAACSKCGGDGWITERSLSRWLKKQEGPDYF